MITWHKVSQPSKIDCQQLMDGLCAAEARLPFWLFYDDRGSELFRQITMTPEYYLTRIEKLLLKDYAQTIASLIGENKHWVEPGAGCCDKAAQLLKSVKAKSFSAMDISEAALTEAAKSLQQMHYDLPIHLYVVDLQKDFSAITDLAPPADTLIFYPGSSIGNYSREDAVAWLKRLSNIGEQLFIGFDRVKEESILNAAYNDADGVTNQFHLNMLHHLEALGFDLNVPHFRHRAAYNANAQRIEMRLVAAQDTDIRLAHRLRAFSEGETILTEYSYKYSPEQFDQLAYEAGWTMKHHITDTERWYSLALYELRS